MFQKDAIFRDIFEAADVQKDQVALDVIDKTAYYLALGLATIAATINPEVIIIGGGVSKGGESLLNPVIRHFKKLTYFSVRDTKIKLASLFNQAGCFGAYYLVKRKMKTNE